MIWTFSLERLLQPLPVLGVNELVDQAGVGVEVFWGLAQHLLDHRAHIFKASRLCKTIAEDEVPGIFNQLAKVYLTPAWWLLNCVDSTSIDCLLNISLHQHVRSLHFSSGVSEDTGLGGGCLTHCPFEFLGDGLPAPGSVLLAVPES